MVAPFPDQYGLVAPPAARDEFVGDRVWLSSAEVSGEHRQHQADDHVRLHCPRTSSHDRR
jgi:hypothetical protein